MNTFLVNGVNDKGGRRERSERVGSREPAETVKIFNFSVVLYIYFNSFNSFLCFRMLLVVLFQCVIIFNEDISNHNEDISNHNEDISNHNVVKNNLAMMTKIIYNTFNDDKTLFIEYFLSDLVKYKKGVLVTPLKSF